MNIKTLVAAVVLLGATAAAQATNYTIPNLPVIPPSTAPFSQAVTVPIGAFSDRWSFTFPNTAGSVSSTVASLELQNILNITGLQIGLYRTSDNALLASGAQAGQSAALNNVVLTSGNSYYYAVTGNGTGTSGGAYTFIAAASPVPEPGTYGLVLAGLAAVGFVARRRSPA
jgi:hypothetical protein